MKQKIGVMGGTFNPIHNAHLKIAEDFAKKLSLDRVLVIPTGIPPHKVYADSTCPEDRLAMCRLAAVGRPLLKVLDIELKRPGPSYTADTLFELRQLYPEAGLYFLTGADMFLTIQNWKNPRKIFSFAAICAAPRDEADFSVLQNHGKELKLKYGSLFQYELLDAPVMPISSTEIRRLVRGGEPVAGLVPPLVADYIEQRKLYQ